jgi:hypothetical protein
MASKTYLPTLLFIGRQLLAYCGRYDEKIRSGLTSIGVPLALYDGLILALQAFVYGLSDAMDPVQP